VGGTLSGDEGGKLGGRIALAISGGSVGSVGRVAARGRAVKSTAVSQDGPIPSAARPEPSRPRRCLDEPLSPLDLSHFQLACRSQRHPCRRHRCLLGSRTWLSFRTRRRGLEHLQLAPLSFSLVCGCALPSSLFSPAPVSPCASRTRHGLTTRHFSHWPRRTRTVTIGPFPPCEVVLRQ